ncbi:Ig-like domain-containing protein [Chitinophaga horti]|uniref:Ig-like domain-containing protein n=1 Tax=Chitinophaga horti TaxID=2920382 RepID=A0ABY6J4N2_9BACT|nr:Ig-like domain-containing protein [Chitinophaga horti]UYQ94638.1 Ig-like domain-containing protein [Chitinophaga horti]
MAGTNPTGGYIGFSSNVTTNYAVDIDVNNNGVYSDAVDRRLTGTAVVGANSVFWDGLNGQGVKVTTSGSTTVNMRVILFTGELHFPFIDVENNVNGIVITRTNGGNQGNIVYWDDTNITFTGTPSNPIKTTIDGISSATNGHRWGSTAYSSSDFGNEVILDTWTYTTSAPLTSSVAIQLRESDLETVSVTPNVAALCVGQTVTYTVTMRNNGPSAVTGATARMVFPANLTGLSFGTPVTSGATVTASSTTATQLNATLNMNNGGTVTFTITGTISSLPAGGNLAVTASIMRPADYTDPDATNPDAAAPTDPQSECDSAPSGVGCNNIKISTLVVSPVPTTSNAGADQALCAVTTATLAGNTPAAGTGTWTQVSGPNTATITTPGASNTTVTGLVAGTYNFRWTIASGVCTVSADDVAITVLPALANNTVTAPATTTFCASGDPAVITGSTPTGGTGVYGYQWQSSTDNVTFTNISGATGTSYDPPAISATTYFRRQVTSGGCSTPSSSNVIMITVQAAISNNTITAPATAVFCGSGNADVIAGTTPSGGNNTFAYQWQSSLDNSTWSNISGAIAQTYDPPPAAATVYYRRLVTSGACTTAGISNVVTISVNAALTAGTVAGNQTFCVSGDPAAFTQSAAPNGGNSVYTYQWQISTTSATSGFSNITGATGATYDAPSVSATTYYRRVVSSEGCTDAVSNTITVTVTPALTAGTVAASQAFCASGDPAVFTQTAAPTGGNGVYSYQWQSSTTSATTGFADITGATSATYDAPSISTTTYYRRIVRSDACADAISNVLTVTINPAIGNNTISANQTICAGSTPAALTGSVPAGGSGSFTYRWESSTTGSANFTTAAGTATAQNYAPGAISQNTIFRRIVSSGACGEVASNIVQINVTAAPTTANAGADQGPLNATAVTLAGNAPTVGNGTWTQVSGPNTANIQNPTQPGTSVSGLVAGNYVFRWTISNAPCTASSDDVTITVNAAPVAQNDASTTNEDTQVTINVAANDSDADGTLQAGSVVIVTQPANGTLTVNANNTVIYIPAANYNGTDNFSYTIKDNLGTVSNVATVTLTIIPVNDVPVAGDDKINALQDQVLNLPPPGLLANDFDADGEQLSASVVSFPANGTLVINSDGSLTYTPRAGYVGQDVFSYKVCDASNTCDTGTVTIDVGNVNDVPVANADTYTVAEDNVLTVAAAGVLTNDTDADGDQLAAALVTGPTKGTLTLNTNGSFVYTPNANANGPDNFTYNACDASGACSTATVTINVTAVNDKPLAIDDAYNTNEDVALTVPAPGLLTNDTDPDNDPLTANVIVQPLNGSVTLNAAGNFVYTPNANYNGIDNFTYRICDNGTPQLCDTGVVTITVSPVNDTVIVAADNYTTAEDVPLSVGAPGVLSNDTDPDGDPLTATVVTQPARGTLAFNANGSFIYTPNANFNGNDSYTYRACDASGACRVATVNLMVTAVNDKPLAVDDSYTLNEDVPLTIGIPGILGNDTDADGDALSAAVVAGPVNGTLTLNANGSFTYTPNANFNGTDQFTYRLCDNGTPQLCDTGLVTFTINPVNDVPVATDDTYTIAEDGVLTVTAPGVLGNDSDVDGNTLTAAVLVGPLHGTLTMNSNGGFVYTPAANYNGPDSYTYRVCDNSGACDTGAVSITVTAVNDRPTAAADAYTIAEDNTLNVATPGVLFNDRDADGDALTVTLVSTTPNGTLTLNANGSFNFVPAANFNGVTSFRYSVCDGGNLCDTTTATITVTAVNDAPVAGNDTYTLTEDVPLSIAAPGLLANDTDADGDALTATIATNPVHGTVTVNSNGSFVYTPAANYNGADTFTYRVCDPSGACVTGRVALTVAAANDAPEAGNDAYTVQEDATLTISGTGVLFNDVDLDNDPLTAVVVRQPAHGTLTLNAAGNFTYTPAPNYNGTDTFTYRACDNGTPSLCDTGVVVITVTPVSDPPVAGDDNYTVAEDLPLTIAAPGLLANDVDPDQGQTLSASVFTPPVNGTITIDANGSFVYTPRANFNGIDRFVYRVCDNGAPSLCDTATVTITVTAVNDAPVTASDNYSVDEDAVLTVPGPGVLLNDVEVDGEAMTAALQVQAAHGVVTVSANGGFIYTPNADFNGIDSFTYRACDPSNNCSPGVVRIVVNNTNDAPVAVNDTLNAVEDVPLTIAAPGLLGNDTDRDGDVLIASINTQPVKGAVVLNNNGSFTYTPDADANGVDTFRYNVCDPGGACAIGLVVINITPVNDTVQARDDEYNTPEDVPLNVAAPGVLSNDVDRENDPLTVSLIGSIPATKGTLVLNPDGSFQFTPTTDTTGTITIRYSVCEANGACDTATIIINVGETNDPPVAVDDNRPEYAIGEDSTLTIPAAIGVLANDTDPDNTTLSATIATPPANGTLTLNADGSFVYIPNLNFNGTDQFTYNVCDANNACDAGTVTITVRPVNDAPVAASDSVTTAEDTPVSGQITAALDVDNDAVTYTTLVSPAFGAFTINATGGYTYTPNADFSGSDQLVYIVCDNGNPSLCDTGRLNITVTPVNDIPVANNDLYTVNEDNTLTVASTGGVLNNDFDRDAEPMVASLDVPPARGQVTLDRNGGFVYTPQLNFNGLDSFTYRACDVSNACGVAKAYINVLPVNDAPVAVADTFYRAEDTTITFPPSVVLINDIDVDGDVLSGYPIGSLSNGTFVSNPDGTYTYTPAPNFNGIDYIDYVVCDNGNPSLCDTGNIVLIIVPRNDPPVALGDTYTLAEDGFLEVDAANGVLANDTDPDGEALASVLVTTANGTVLLNTNGSFSYRPNPNFNGVDTFVYRACDISDACDTAVVRITVTPVNDRPVAVDDVFTRSEDTVITFGPGVVLANDFDPDGDVLTGTPLGQLTKGTFTTNPDGTYTYTPARNFNGTDSIYYVVCDPAGLCDTGLIRLIITPVNDAPVASPIYYSVTEDQPLTEPAPGIIGDDKDPDGEDIVAGLVAGPIHGTLTLNADGSFSYVPDRDFNGRDSVIFSLCDIQAACDTAIAYFDVLPVNDPPVVAGITFNATEDTPLTVAAPGVLGNSSDPDGDPLTATLIDGPQSGTLVLNPDGSFTYTPNANYNGQDAFTVNICDNGTPQSCGQITVVLNIAAVDDVPVAVSDSLTIAEDNVLNVPAPGILANDINRDDDPVTASIVTTTTRGQLSLDGGGNLQYTPALNFNGLDSAVYQLCKANGLCDTAKIYITVTAVNDAPIAVNDLFVRAEDTVITFPPSVALINDIDPDGDVLNGRPIGSLTKGSFTANPDGTYTYRPLPNFNGVDSIQYEVCDPGGLCDTGLIRLIIEPRNDAPVAGDDNYSTNEDIALSVPAPGVLANDVDVDENDALNVTILRNPSHGTLRVNSDNSFLYTPAPNYFGVDTFWYVVYDAAGLRDTGTVLITVNTVNDAPVAVDNVYTLDERSSVSDNILANDSDPDNDPLTASVVTGPANGVFTLNPNGTFTYTPNVPFIGIDQVVYAVCDTGNLCDTAIVTFNVQNVNDKPLAVDDNVTAREDSLVTGNVLTNDSDPDGDALTATLVTAPVNGAVVLNADGSFTYTPNANYNGPDSLVYRICDNGGPVLCDTAVVRFTVVNVNDKPVAIDDTLTVTEDTPATGNVLTNDTDLDGDALTASLVTAPVNGSVVLNADGSFTYTPNANYNGLDSLVYAVCDNGTPVICDTAVVRFTVTAVNDKPSAVDDAVTVVEDTPATGNVLTNDADLDGDGLSASLVTAPVNGSVVLNANGSFTYTPNANYNGLDSLVYAVCDNGTPVICDTAIVRFTVTAVNDKPLAVDDAVTVVEDTPATGNVLTNDADPDGDALTASLVTAPANGSVVLNADGSFTYTPNANYNGLDSLVYAVCDNGTPVICDTAIVRFTMTAVNDKPLAVDDAVTVVEDTPATGNVLTNDADPDGDALTASLVTAPVNGSVVLNADGSFTYIPNANYNGADSLVYAVCDNGTPVICDTAVVRFTVTAVNDKPLAVDDAVTVVEDTPATGNVLTNDSDLDGDALTASLVTAPVNGSVVLNADGSFTYTPNANYNGADSLVYAVCDNGTPVICDTAVVRFTVTAVNDKPSAVDDAVTVVEDTPATGNVLTNDADLDGDALTASLVTAPANGSVVLNADGSFTYTPNANYNGADSLVYAVCDNGTPVICDTAIVRFTVTAVNDKPLAVDDAVTVVEDTPTTGNVLTNDSDIDGNTLTATLVTPPVNGTVVLNADGSFTYTPNANYNGADSLVYAVCDNGTPVICDTAIVRFTVTAVNDKPLAVDDAVTVVEDTPTTGNVLTNDSDIDGNTLTATLVTPPVNGTVVLNADGSFTYTPNANYNGADSLVYAVCDNGTPVICDTAIVRFTVTAVNDKPLAVDDAVTVVEDTPTTGNVLTNDSDIDGNTLTATLVTPPVNGSVVLNADGSFTYTPNANYNGADSLVYAVCDNGTPVICDTAIVRFTVTAVNDKPLAVDDAVTVVEDTPTTGNVLTNDSDIDGNTLTATLVTPPVNGTVVLNADGSFTYTPNANYNGADSLVYAVCDNGTPVICDTAIVRFTVTAVNDKPLAVDDAVTVVEDTPTTGNVLTNDSDIDGNTLTATLVTPPVNGTVVLNADGSFTYTPNANYNGADSLVYAVCDNGTPVICDTAIVRFTVTAVNDKPLALDDAVTVVEDTPTTGNVLTNDSDIDGNNLTATLVTPPVNGTVVLNADGSFTYTPNANYNGADSLVYAVCDNGTPVICDTAIVRFTVTAVNDKPLAVDDTVLVTEDVLASGNVLTNDTDVEGGTLTATLINGGANGTIGFNPDGSFTYLPNANYNGPDSLVYLVCDNGTPSQCDTGIVRFIVSAVNDAPVAVADTITVTEDMPATGNVLANDIDVEGGTLTATLVTAPVNGTVVLNGDGSFTYTPNANYNGADSLVYSVCDNGTPVQCATGVVRFFVAAVNDKPVAVNDTVLVTEDVLASGNVLTNDTDVEGGTLTATLINGGAHGTIGFNPDGSFTYLPNANYNGPDSLVYLVCDNGTPSQCDTGIVRFIVGAVDDAPIAVADTINVTEDQPATGNVLANDIDPDGGPLNATVVTNPAHGTLVLNPNGTFTYTPALNYNGVDSFRYLVCDNSTPALCDTGVVRFSFTAVPDAPVAVRDTVAVTEDQPANANVLTNDYDPDGDVISSTIITGPKHGTATLSLTGNLVYTPAADFNGIDSITYEICDPTSRCSRAVVIFDVEADNDAPVAQDDTVTTTEDVPVTGNVLTNDTDPEGNTLTASLVLAPESGTVVLNADGSFTYTSAADFFGTDSLVYQVCDNGTPSLCDTAVLKFTVTSVNDAPVALPDTLYSNGGAIAGSVVDNDVDPEGDDMSTSMVTAPVNGTVVLNADGSIVYTPNPGFQGRDSLLYAVCDNGSPSACDTAKVMVFVANQAPVAVNDTVQVLVPAAATFNVLTNDSDPNGDALTVTLLNAPSSGTLQSNGNGSYTYTADNSFVGTVTITYQVCDNATPAACDTATIFLVVVNQRPVANDDTLRTVGSQMVTGNLLTNDTDANGNSILNATVVKQPTNGQIVINGLGSATYMPNAGFAGIDTAIYAVCDNGTPALCDTAYVFIIVGQGNRSPIAMDDAVNVNNLQPANANVLANDNDPDGNNLTASLVTAPVNGTVVLNADGSLTYTANAGFTGTDVLVYQVCDNGTPSFCDTASVTFTVVSGNRAPVAMRDTIGVNNLQPATGNVLNNDTDPDGNNLTASLVTAPLNGTVVLNANGSLTYTANANFTGTDTLVYQVCDNGTPSLCDTASVTFTVVQGNRAPIANNDTMNVNNLVPATGNVLTNDSDPDGGTLTPSVVTAPANGTLVLNNDGTFTYTANAGYTGNDFADYRVCDNGTPQRCDTARMVFRVIQGNLPPEANNDTVRTNNLTPATGNVLTNDRDPENSTMTVTILTAPANGSVTLNSDGSFTYIPATGFTGTEFMDYRVCDAGVPQRCDTARVVFVVGQGNRAPLAVDDTARTVSPQPVTGNALANDSDADGNTLTGSLITQPANGTINFSANGTFTYTPNTGFVGTDAVDYRVCDNGTPQRCDTGRITFIVAPNLPPVAIDDTLRVTGPTPVNGNVLTNDSDPNGRPGLTSSLVTGPRNGTLVINANGSVTYTADAGYYGLDSATYRICDNGSPALCDEGKIVFVISDITRAMIGASKAVSEPILLPDGSYQFTFTFVVRNMGNTALGNISLNDDLTNVFPAPMDARVVAVTATGNLVANAQYNGRGNINLLAASSALAPGVTDSVKLDMKVFPNGRFGTFNNRATAGGTASGGATVTDLTTVGLNPDTNNDGMPDENEVTPVGLPEIKIRIPEGFSPNGDGKNDFFVLQGVGTDRIALEVYNRWGNVVYRSDSYQNNWNGKCNTGIRYGEDVPDGTYYYIVRNLTTGEKFVSYITIMR